MLSGHGLHCDTQHLIAASATLFDFWITSETEFSAQSRLLVPAVFCGRFRWRRALPPARRWVAAGLALPVALWVFLGLYLFIVFVIPHFPAPTLVFVALLFPLNGVALWLARRFLTDMGRKTF